MNRNSSRSAPGVTMVAALALMLVAPRAHSVQSVDEAFFNYVIQVCAGVDPLTQLELFKFCDKARGGGLAGGVFVASAGVSNLSISGGQSTSSQSSAAQQRKELKEKLQGEDKEKGGSASYDFKLGRLGGFLSVLYGKSDRDQTDLEQGYDSDLHGALAGLDYRFSDALLAGVSLGYTKDKLTYDQGSGGLDTESWSATLYGTYVPRENAYLSAYLAYADMNYDGTRNVLFGGISGTTNSGTGGDQWRAGVGGGYDWPVGNWTAGAFANLDYVTTDVDAYAETGNTGLEMIYPAQTSRSLTSLLGVRASGTWGSVSPEIRVGWAHEFENNARRINTRLAVAPTSVFTVTTDAPDRDYLVSGVGATIETARGLLVFIDYERMDAHSFLDSWTVSAGVLGEF